MTLRIVSLNAWGGAQWGALSQWAKAARFDVLCLQEVTRLIEASLDWLVYRDPYRTLDQRADLFGDISGCLPGWQAVFAPAARGPLEGMDGTPVLSEHGLACWVAPHLAVTARSQGLLFGQFRGNGWGPEPVSRTVQSLRIEGAGEAVALTHLHGLRDPVGKGDTPERALQSKALCAHLRSFRQGTETCVVAGDLNLLPSSATFHMLGREGLTDLVTTRGHDDTRTALYTKAQRHANYCLVSDVSRVAAFDVPALPILSDHRPLVLHLR